MSLFKSLVSKAVVPIVLMALAVTTASAPPASAYIYSTQKGARRTVIEIYGYGPVEYTDASGLCVYDFSDPYVDDLGYITVNSELIEMYLEGDDILVRRNMGPPSPGVIKGIEPGIDFPAESFFDVMYEIEIPGHFPGDPLINYEPMHLTSTIEQIPPYFSTYVYLGPPIALYNTSGIEVAAIIEWEEYITPYYPPEAFITCRTSYKSEVAEINEAGLIELPAFIRGFEDDEIEFAEFSYRPLGSPDPFTVFYVDGSGEGDRASKINPEGTGDGWCGYFEPGSEPFEGQVAEFRVEFFPFGHPSMIDTCTLWIDPTPPIPWIRPDEPAGDPETLRVYNVDSFFDITFELPDELPEPGPAELQVFPLVQRFERTLTPVDQLGLGTELDSTSCGPASAASCLKYFADNGYPGVDNPGGDEAKPEQSGEDIARELQGAMGTNDSTGTTGAGMIKGIEDYLEGHGQSGWSVSGHAVGSDADLAAMFREFEADSEDVIVLLQDTTSTGDTTGHWVTMGSREQIQHSADSTSQKIDFMDPWGGGSTADNNYDVGENDSGNHTTSGYDLDGAGGDAWISGYIKVSPPEGAGSPPGMIAGTRPGAPAFDPNWIPVDSGIARGHGLVDTLHWDTGGFMPGLYLMEVITTNHQGHTCRDIRLVLLTDPATGEDPMTPGVKTGLQGTYPNPFNPVTHIVFSMEKDGPVTLAVFDVAGRRIRTLIDGKTVEAGHHTIRWDGLDDSGRRVSSGVYFCRFAAENTDSATKMILLR